MILVLCVCLFLLIFSFRSWDFDYKSKWKSNRWFIPIEFTHFTWIGFWWSEVRKKKNQTWLVHLHSSPTSGFQVDRQMICCTFLVFFYFFCWMKLNTLCAYIVTNDQVNVFFLYALLPLWCSRLSYFINLFVLKVKYTNCKCVSDKSSNQIMNILNYKLTISLLLKLVGLFSTL